MPTLKQVTDAYSNNPQLKQIIDAYINGFPEQFEEVTINCDGETQCFKHVSDITTTGGVCHSIIHANMIFGHITDLHTNIIGTIRSTTRKIGERMYKE